MKAVLILALLALAGTAHAADAPAPAAPAVSADLSGVTVVVPRDAPVVASTFPVKGSTVAPGILVLTIAFDQKMLDTKGSFGRGVSGDMPECLDEPLLRADGKTFVLLCRTKPATRYEIALNAGTEIGFTNLGRRAATAYVLDFQTSTAEPVYSLPGAMRAAKLPETESPIRSTPRIPAVATASAAP